MSGATPPLAYTQSECTATLPFYGEHKFCSSGSQFRDPNELRKRRQKTKFQMMMVIHVMKGGRVQ